MAAGGGGGTVAAIGVDVGTSGVRAAALDGTGLSVALSSVAFAEGRSDRPDVWFECVAAALAGLRARCPALDAARRIAVAGTSGTLLALNASGEPVGPAAMYNAPAAAETLEAVARVAP